MVVSTNFHNSFAAMYFYGERWDQILDEIQGYLNKPPEFGGWCQPRERPPTILATCSKCGKTSAIWMDNHYECRQCGREPLRFDNKQALAVAEVALTQIRQTDLPTSVRYSAMQRLLQVSEV